MAITLEDARRGSESVPLGLYREGGRVSGTCMTPLHYHKDLELILAVEGSTHMIVDGEILETRPGVLYFINPYQIHSMQVLAPPSRYDCLVVPPRLLSLPVGHAVMADLITPIYSGKLCFVSQTEDPFLIDLFKRITGCYDKKEEQAAVIIAHLLLFLDYCRTHGLLKETSAQTTTPVCRAIDYIQSNYNRKISLEEIAAQAGMNAKYFCSYFKKHTLTTPITYLTMLRIRQAKLLLREGRLSVLEVALSCGFDNVSFFIRQFKAETGQTPGQYRRNKTT